MQYELEILDNGTTKFWYYDVNTNTFYDENQNELLTEYDCLKTNRQDAILFSKESSSYKYNKNPQLLEIMLGLKCNFNCFYCSQRTVRDKLYSSSPKDVEPFINLLKATEIKTKRIQLWGGEPLVYWKVIKKLVPALKELYPDVQISFPTNGSLLTRDKIDFIKQYDMQFWISHDGCNNEGREADGHLDILQDPVVLDAIQYAKQVLSNGAISFKSTFTHNNTDVRKIIKFFKNTLGKDTFVSTGNVVFCHDASNELSVKSSILTENDKQILSDSIFDTLDATPKVDGTLHNQYESLRYSFLERRSATKVTCECGGPIDKGSLVIDMLGNIQICHTFPVITGTQRNIAKDLCNYQKLGYTHAFNRETSCKDCLVLHSCKGGCPGLSSKEHKLACPNLFAMHYGIFRAAFSSIFGKYLVNYRKIA